VLAVVAICRAGARADAASAAELARFRCAPVRTGIPGLTVWEHSDRIRLEHARFAAGLHIRRRGASHRAQRRPAACA